MSSVPRADRLLTFGTRRMYGLQDRRDRSEQDVLLVSACGAQQVAKLGCWLQPLVRPGSEQ
jgi:hypothetical protein